MVKYSINYLWNYWSSVLETWHHKCASQKKQNDTLSCYHDNSFAAGAVSIKTEIPSFCLYHLLQPIQRLDLRQYGNYVCSKQDPLSHFKGCKWGHLFFYDREKLELKELLWQQNWGCHFVPFKMHICGAKFEEHCFNISRDIFYSAFYHF